MVVVVRGGVVVRGRVWLWWGVVVVVRGGCGCERVWLWWGVAVVGCGCGGASFGRKTNDFTAKPELNFSFSIFSRLILQKLFQFFVVIHFHFSSSAFFSYFTVFVLLLFSSLLPL